MFEFLMNSILRSFGLATIEEVETPREKDLRQAKIAFNYLLLKGIDSLRKEKVEMGTFRPDLTMNLRWFSFWEKNSINIMPDNSPSGASLKLNSSRRISGSKDLLKILKKYSYGDYRDDLDELEEEARDYFIKIGVEDSKLVEVIYGGLLKKGEDRARETGRADQLVERINRYCIVGVRTKDDAPKGICLTFCEEGYPGSEPKDVENAGDLLSMFKEHFKRGYRTRLYRFAEAIA